MVMTTAHTHPSCHGHEDGACHDFPGATTEETKKGNQWERQAEPDSWDE